MLPGCVPWPVEFQQRYRRAGHWRGEVLGSLLREWAGRDPHRTAVVAAGTRHSYGELDLRADRLAAGFAELGIRPPDRVVVQLGNRVEFVEVCVALFRLGALPVLALPAHRRSELTYLSEYTEAVAIIVGDRAPGVDFRALAREVTAAVPTLTQVLVAGDPGGFTALADVAAPVRDLPTPEPSDVAFLLLSGGTTGLPKLIPRTHDDYAFQLRATAEAMGFDEQGVYLAVVPVAHNAALGCPGVLGALRAGGRAVLTGSPSPDEVFPLVRDEGVTLTTVMPPLLPLWMDTAGPFGADLSGVTIEVGGANLRPEVGREVRPRLGATLSHWFGMAEGVLCFTRPDDPQDLAATTAGSPLCADDEYRVADAQDRAVPRGEVGELLVRGPCTLRGYYRAAEHNQVVFTPDGFLRTGDLVRWTSQGHLVVVGRTKDVVNRGGEKISTHEIETHLAAHPAVHAAAAVAVPDAAFGEKSCAVVVVAGSPPSLAELRTFLTGRGLADYKLPDRLEIVDALPHTTVGKVDKRALTAALHARKGR